MAGKSKSSGVKYGGVLAKYAQFIQSVSEVEEKEYMSVGPLSLNLGVGDIRGVPMGRLIQLVGRQSSGKSSLALDIIAQYQQSHPDENVFYIDLERSLDPKYVAACGVDLDRLLRVTPNVTEEGLDIIEAAIEGDETKLVILDSMAAARSSTEDGKSYSDNQKIASNATLMTRFCNRVIGLLDNKAATVVIINQLRKNMSTLSRETEIPFGGMAVQYALNLSIHLNRISTEETKQTIEAIVKKNKVGAPQQRVQFTLNYGRGIDHADDILTLALKHDIVQETSKGRFEYNGVKAHGRANAIETYDTNELKQLVLERLQNV